MANDVDLNSKRWLDLVFEGRNKKFGAYELRESSSQRHILAIGVVVIAILALVFLPKLIKQPASPPPVVSITQQRAVEVTEVIIPEKMPARAVEVQVAVTPTSTRQTIGFTEPVIVNTEVLPDDREMLTQTEITNSGAEVGTTTRGGDIVGEHPDNIPPPVVQKAEEPFWNPEKWPEFDGDLLKWLSSNIHYPMDALELGIEGRVTLRFVIQKDGTIGNVEVLKKLSPSCDREAMRVVSMMPKWIPGSQGKHAVAVYYTLPIHFRIQK